MAFTEFNIVTSFWTSTSLLPLTMESYGYPREWATANSYQNILHICVFANENQTSWMRCMKFARFIIEYSWKKSVYFSFSSRKRCFRWIFHTLHLRLQRQSNEKYRIACKNVSCMWECIYWNNKQYTFNQKGENSACFRILLPYTDLIQTAIFSIQWNTEYRHKQLRNNGNFMQCDVTMVNIFL